jgi:hypothetical protein
MVRHIHQSYPQIVNMCQILEPAAESLVYRHRLSDDDLEDVAQDLERYLNKDWKRECGQHVSRPGTSCDRGATPRRRMANVDKSMENPGGILI